LSFYDGAFDLYSEKNFPASVLDLRGTILCHILI
jgi:hypothetical protein